MYDNIFNFSDDEVKTIREDIIEDKKQEFRKESISNEGTDPAEPAQEDQMKPQPSMNDESEDEEPAKDKKRKRDQEDRDTYGVRDVLGKYDYTHSARKDNTPDIKHNFRKSPLALSHLDKLKSHYDKKEVKMINEVENLEEQLKEKPSKLN